MSEFPGSGVCRDLGLRVLIYPPMPVAFQWISTYLGVLAQSSGLVRTCKCFYYFAM